MDAEQKKRKIALYTTIEFICILFITILGNCFDWVNLTFTFDKIKTWKYWSNVIVQTLMYSSAILSAYLFRMEKEELNNKYYLDGLTKYRDLLKFKKDSFTVFIDNYFNPKTKKIFIAKKFERKLYRLDRHSKDIWKIEFSEAIKLSNPEEYNYSTEAARKYAKKRIEYEKLVSKEYIEDNWKYISVRYPRVPAGAFTYYIRQNQDNTSDYKVLNDTAKELPLRFLKKCFSAALCALCIGCIAWDPQTNELLAMANGWISILIKYMLRVFMVGVNVISGLYFGKEIFYSNFILPIDNRSRILKEYITWDKEQGGESSYGDKIIEAYNKQKELSNKLKVQIEEAKKVNKTE